MIVMVMVVTIMAIYIGDKLVKVVVRVFSDLSKKSGEGKKLSVADWVLGKMGQNNAHGYIC